MRPVSPVIPTKDFPEIIVAEHQEEYQNLPSIRCTGGYILTRWKLSDEEKAIVAETGDIYLWQMNGSGPVTPILLQVETPELENPVEYKDEVLESEVLG